MEIRCTHCGADVPIQETSEFVKCPFCSAGLFVELAGGISHYLKIVAIDSANLQSFIQRFLATKEITQPVHIGKFELVYQPFWRFEKPNGPHELICGAVSLAEDTSAIKTEPSGDLKYFSEDLLLGCKVVEPEILLNEARNNAAGAGTIPSATMDIPGDLIHLPFFEVQYTCGADTYSAWVDGIEGKVVGDTLPPTPQAAKSRTLALIALVSFLLFFVETVKLPSLWLFVAYPITGIVIFYSTTWLLRRLGW